MKHGLSSKLITVLFGTLTILGILMFFILDFFYQGSLPLDTLKAQFAFTQGNFKPVFEKILAGDNRYWFEISLYVDFVFIIFYVILLSSLISRAIQTHKIAEISAISSAVIVCIIAGISDYFENILHLLMLYLPEKYVLSMVSIASLFAVSKVVHIGLALITYVYIIVFKPKKEIAGQK